MSEIENYILHCDAEKQDILSELRQVIIKNAPPLTEKNSWGMPTFFLNGKNLVHFASHKKHIGVYPGDEAIVFFEEKLKGYTTSKGTIQLLYSDTLPTDLIAEIVHFCVNNNIARTTERMSQIDYNYA